MRLGLNKPRYDDKNAPILGQSRANRDNLLARQTRRSFRGLVGGADSQKLCKDERLDGHGGRHPALCRSKPKYLRANCRSQL
jgi:hypothetical protein